MEEIIIKHRVLKSKSNGSKTIIEKAHEGSWIMLIPLLILAFGSIFLGYIFKDLMVGFGSSFFADTIYSHYTDTLNGEFLPHYIKMIPVIFSLFGACLAFMLYFYFMPWVATVKTTILKKVYHFLSSKWYFDVLYNKFIGLPIFKFGYNVTYLLFDKGIIELFGPKGLSNNIYFLAKNLRNYHSGLLYNYICFFIFIFLAVYFAYAVTKVYFF